MSHFGEGSNSILIPPAKGPVLPAIATAVDRRVGPAAAAAAVTNFSLSLSFTFGNNMRTSLPPQFLTLVVFDIVVVSSSISFL